ncbi:S8 family serine peptidase [Natronolimnobius sp. AArcel1]|uniref:S8 family serine peptidase n=1 Tax=Natronolimnobius sp. AArcel1 TaxID=1679093 RepID=UPI0013EBADF4|nr:S8 family serine peptidase [Natronolimnobius sp. AArcel1]NGM67780.1 S8 family serine peptidase [Natronolimnobius sp. AArcel1]
MSVAQSGRRTRAGVVTTAVLLFTVVLGVALAGGVGAIQPTGDEATAPAPIDDELTEANGTVSVLVRLEAFDETHAETSADSIAARQSHAETSQQPLEQYANATEGIHLERGFWVTNAALVTVETDRAESPLEDLARLEVVRGLEADEEVTLSSAVTASPAATGGAGEAYTDGLETIRAPEVWNDFHTRGDGTTVAILDSGVDGEHADLEIDGWKDFSDEPAADPVDYDGHGTRVSGIVGGGNESGSHIGVAPDATLLHGAVATDCDDRCRAQSSNVLAGIEWALAEDADVISLSLGWQNPGPATVNALENARETGTVVVAGVGNGGEGTSLSPGNAADVISVGAVDRRDRVPSFSGGEKIDTAATWGSHAPDHWPDSYVVPNVVAPGVSIETTNDGGGHTHARGTSMSAPHVAGAVALVQAGTAENLEPDEIKYALETTAWKPDGEPDETDTRYGDGIIDTYAALEAVGTHATLEGTVRDAETDGALSNVSVEVSADETVYERTTDTNGTFKLPGLEGDREYTITVEKPGYDTMTETKTIPAETTADLDVSLAGSGSIEVDVTDDHFGEGIETATVEAVSSSGTYTGSHTGNGSYRLENVPTESEYNLSITAMGYGDSERTVSAMTDTDDTRAETVTLVGDATLEVAVETEDSEPIENATVLLERDGANFEAGTTDNAGALAVTVPGTGERYALEAVAPDSSFESASVETDSVESGETVAVTVALSEPLPVSGFGVRITAIAFLTLVLAVAARGHVESS